MKKGFSLLEMLIVVGIIGILAVVGGVSFSALRGSAEKAKGQEYVSQVATALTALYNDNDGVWPAKLRDNGATDGRLDAEVAYLLASKGYLSLTYDTSTRKLSGADRFGLVSPWAQKAIRSSGASASESTRVTSGGSVSDHVLHYAVDLDGDGVISASVGGESVKARATVMVWCAGKDGKMETYRQGLKKDDVYSWSKGQTRNVK